MKARLIIKNFGPITDLDIEIKKYNILIGPQASGKSTIAKLLCMIHDFFKQEKNNPNIEDKSSSDKKPIILFVKLLRNYRIEGYFYEGTYLSFEDSFLKITIDNNVIINTNVHLLASNLMTYYIPAERIALPMITESLFELTSEQSTLPQFFLNFGREFTLARGRHDNDKILPGFDLNFEFRNGKNYIKF
jgi:energy-coupling factor transporter ATP-binding protein EcfA2